jgi:hypothetical protein
VHCYCAPFLFVAIGIIPDITVNTLIRGVVGKGDEVCDRSGQQVLSDNKLGNKMIIPDNKYFMSSKISKILRKNGKFVI